MLQEDSLMNDTTLILASASPRRRELLSLTGLPFTVDAPDVPQAARDNTIAKVSNKANNFFI